MMKNNKTLDFTDNFKKIFHLANTVRELRTAFPFSKKDSRAEHDHLMIKKWKKLQSYGTHPTIS